MDCRKKSRNAITVEMKKKIIEKYESGVSVTQLSVMYGKPRTTISTIVRSKEQFKEAKVAKGISKMVKSRNNVTEQMEDLLMVWIKERQLAGDSMSDTVIREKAKKIYNEVRHQTTSSVFELPDFLGTKGWLGRFRRRMGLRSVMRHEGEAADSDHPTAKEHVEIFTNIIEQGGYVPQQVFNCDETGLFWKKMPRRTYITKEEISLPGHKPMKDRLTLLMCANAAGDCKVKPLLVYHSENPMAFKDADKNLLGVMWRSNHRASVTRSLFVQWMINVFCPTVCDFLKENNLPTKALLVLDSASTHPPYVMEELPPEFKFVQVHFLPPKTTSLLQPMQQVIPNFKKLYTKELFRKCFERTANNKVSLKKFWKHDFNIADAVLMITRAWQEVSLRCLQAAWRPLWPEAVPPRDLEGFEEQLAVQEIVCLGNSMDLEVDDKDVEELVEEHNRELSTDEFKELHKEEAQVLQNAIDCHEDDGELGGRKHNVTSQQLKDLFFHWNAVKEIVTQCHPNIGKVELGMNFFDDNVMDHFWDVQKSRLKQAHMDRNGGSSRRKRRR